MTNLLSRIHGFSLRYVEAKFLVIFYETNNSAKQETKAVMRDYIASCRNRREGQGNNYLSAPEMIGLGEGGERETMPHKIINRSIILSIMEH